MGDTVIDVLEVRIDRLEKEVEAMQALKDRIILNEASAKQAHKRIDGVQQQAELMMSLANSVERIAQDVKEQAIELKELQKDHQKHYDDLRESRMRALDELKKERQSEIEHLKARVLELERRPEKSVMSWTTKVAWLVVSGVVGYLISILTQRMGGM